ncbi:hypothetical protein [Pedomonas mirosovicensis]|uniref:hypothetical protein n=1 Tax=Pedomonas mirosovicensis TaxID=2908641 RepID=UPI002167F3BD|nr:hypothetical protein [Pedomonas mirosovicensis]MCH8686609.1 hypothetical protein [Pedomonas mirosovicensis]
MQARSIRASSTASRIVDQYQAVVSAGRQFESAVANRVPPSGVADKYRSLLNSFAKLQADVVATLDNPSISVTDFVFLESWFLDLYQAAKSNIADYAVVTFDITSQESILEDTDRLLFSDGAELINLPPHVRPGVRDERGRPVAYTLDNMPPYPRGRHALKRRYKKAADASSFSILRLELELVNGKRAPEIDRLFVDALFGNFAGSARKSLDVNHNFVLKPRARAKLDSAVQNCEAEIIQVEYETAFTAKRALALNGVSDISAALAATNILADATGNSAAFWRQHAAALYWQLRLRLAQKSILRSEQKQLLDQLWATGIAQNNSVIWYALCNLDYMRCGQGGKK